MASVPFLPRAFDSVQNGGKRAGLRWFRNAPKVGELVHKKATRKAARALGKKKLAAFKQEYKRVEPDGATVFFGDNMQGDRFAGAVLEGGMIRKKNAFAWSLAGTHSVAVASMSGSPPGTGNARFV